MGFEIHKPADSNPGKSKIELASSTQNAAVEQSLVNSPKPDQIPSDQQTKADHAARLLAFDAFESLFGAPNAVRQSMFQGSTFTEDSLHSFLLVDEQSHQLPLAEHRVLSQFDEGLKQAGVPEQQPLAFESLLSFIGRGSADDGFKAALGELSDQMPVRRGLSKQLADEFSTGALDEQGRLSLSGLINLVPAEKMLGKSAAESIITSFLAISHDGQTISRDDLTQFDDETGRLSKLLVRTVPEDADNLEAQRTAAIANFMASSDSTQLKKAGEWATQMEEKVKNGELSASEASRTYYQVNRLLSGQSDYLTDDQRVNVAAEILFHTGSSRIDQGVHGTCNATVLENIAFASHPAQAAEIIATAALTGKWTSTDGKEISIPQGSMKPGWEESQFPPDDMLRSHASQIFQTVVLNDVGQHDVNDPRQFVQMEKGISSLLFDIGTEMLPWAEYWMPNGYEVWKHKDGSETNFDGLSGPQIAEESKRLFGDKYEVLAYQSPYETWSHPFEEPYKGPDYSKYIKSEAALREKFIQLSAENRLPAIVGVNGSNRAIDREANSALSVAGSIISGIIRPVHTTHDYIDRWLGIANHVVAITKFDAKNDRVYVSNSWGQAADGWISVHELWGAL